MTKFPSAFSCSTVFGPMYICTPKLVFIHKPIIVYDVLVSTTTANPWEVGMMH